MGRAGQRSSAASQPQACGQGAARLKLGAAWSTLSCARGQASAIQAVPAGSARLSPACSQTSSAGASLRFWVTQTQPASTRNQRATAAAGSVRAWRGSSGHTHGATSVALG